MVSRWCARSLVSLLVLFAVASAHGEDLGLRQPALSPDGAWLVFVWGGDLWRVPSNGGEAERLYGTAADERRPIWSPDGGTIAFAAQRATGYDLFVLPSHGGAVRRLTWAPGDDLPTGFSPDGRSVLFQSRRGDGKSRVYEVSVEGGEPVPLTNDESTDGVLSPNGRDLAFTTGTLPWWRTASRGTSARRLLVQARGGGPVRRVEDGDAQQLWPQWMPDGRTILFVSSASLVGNLWLVDLESGQATRLTDHTEESVRFPALAADGSRVAYEEAGAIYVRKLRGGEQTSERIPIELPVDLDALPPDTISPASGVERVTVDPSGRRLACERRGEIFLADLTTSLGSGPLACLAPLQSAWRESDARFSPDGRRLLFVSDESGRSSVRVWDLSDPAAAVVTELRTPAGEARLVAWSPDGEFFAYVRRSDRDVLVLADAGGGRERDLCAADRIDRVAFRPDGRSIACMIENAQGTREVLWQPIYAGLPLRWPGSPVAGRPPLWSPDGRRLVWIEQGEEGAFLKGVDFAGRAGEAADSIVASTWPRPPGSLIAAAFSGNDRGDLLLLSRLEGKGGIWRVSSRGDSLVRVACVDSSLVEICPLTDGSAVCCLGRSGALFKVDGKSGRTVPVAMTGQAVLDRREQFRQIFLEATAALGAEFYDPGMHLKDWPRIRARYLERLPGCRTAEELRELILMAAGELDASHVNLEPAIDDRGPADGDLGVEVASVDGGDGVRVVRVVPGGPAARCEPPLSPGDRIISLDGVGLSRGRPLESLLVGRSGEEVTLEVAVRKGPRQVRIIAEDAAARRRAEEQATDEERARRVAVGGGGRLAYFHLRSCDQDAAAELAAVLAPSEVDAPDGLVLDLRDNPGGFGMESFLRALSRRPWAELRPRGASGLRFPAGSWRGEVCVLIDETTASAAELIALGIRELGLGTLVGQPTRGAVIAASERTLLDGSRFQLPVTGWYRLHGGSLENRGVTPDLPVENPFGTSGNEDRCLEAAIREALRARAAR